MEGSIFVKRVCMDCPLCDTAHEVEERKRVIAVTIKGEKVEYEERFYFCANSGEDDSEFEPVFMVNENMLNARNAYRKKLKLPVLKQ